MEQTTIPLEAIDEAFATLPRRLSNDQRRNSAPKALDDAHAAGPAPSRYFSDHKADADATSIVPHAVQSRELRVDPRADQLSTELHDLDRQRERVARLLRQIGSHTSA